MMAHLSALETAVFREVANESARPEGSSAAANRCARWGTAGVAVHYASKQISLTDQMRWRNVSGITEAVDRNVQAMVDARKSRDRCDHQQRDAINSR